MKINALFVTRASDTAVPELVDAWDEYVIDDNPDGYGDVVDRWRGTVGNGDVDAFTVVVLEVPEQVIHNALYPDPVEVDTEIVEGSGEKP